MTTPPIPKPVPPEPSALCVVGNNIWPGHDLNGLGACKRCGQVFRLPRIER